MFCPERLFSGLTTMTIILPEKFLAVLKLKLDPEKGGGAKTRWSLSLELFFHGAEPQF